MIGVREIIVIGVRNIAPNRRRSREGELSSAAGQGPVGGLSAEAREDGTP